MAGERAERFRRLRGFAANWRLCVAVDASLEEPIRRLALRERASLAAVVSDLLADALRARGVDLEGVLPLPDPVLAQNREQVHEEA